LSVARRIFAKQARGTTIGQICRQLNAVAVLTADRQLGSAALLDPMRLSRKPMRPPLNGRRVQGLTVRERRSRVQIPGTCR